ncbi:hypothetical protein AEB_P0467 [Altererythrobacter sp. B11]|uniref:NosD domain-containing protein n=1 Tax=Altererythrobacter sp. B11 TaxID=2060312 RepID=UPI000DC6E6A6|nr:right-handed parallel beta-helix repeat-containing protein [Altererythrobacter sp. B11]BBC71335.1 hypothetical protein AEB_P0467 [Altererythrobacter sp. B11]
MAVGDGRADATAALERALGGDATVVFVPDGTYRITRQILVPSGVVLKGTGNAKILIDVDAFSATDPADTYAANACALMFRANRGGGVCGIQFALSAYGAELIAMAIALRGCSKVHVKHCQFEGFSKSKILRVDSCDDCWIHGNEFHDCHLESKADAQLTCIDVDDNRLNGGSTGLRITNNVMRRITVSDAFLSAYGDQTDGINISHASSSGHLIARNLIDTVGEGVDCFGHGCIVRDNWLRSCRNYGVKLVHGARNNVVENNRIVRPGLGGIVLAGSSGDAQDTEGNLIARNVISAVGASGQWPKSTTFGIKLEDDHGARVARNNRITDNVISDGGRMDVGILAADGARDNIIAGNVVKSFARAAYLIAR